MWVCVSDQFNVAELTRKILEAAKVRDNLGEKSLNTIQEILKETLISKKFLLVLDDVWNDNNTSEWNKLVAPLKFGRKGSKILLTTRMDSVADMVRRVLHCKIQESLELSGLKEDDFILLFNKHAFAEENIDDYRNLKLIGEQIAKKLRGYPLAAKVLGGCLNYFMDEKYWRRILNENFLNLKESEDNIQMILRLSYHHLPASLQICFRYCSIFPKDDEFDKNELIRMWIGSGLIKKPTHEKRSLEDIGEEYLNHLARKSFFDIKIRGDGQLYVMHDLLHDLAQLVSSGECLRIEGDGSEDIPKTIRHIYVNRVNPHMISHLKNLRTLIIHGNVDYDHVVVFNEVLKRLKSLRLLEVTAGNCKLSDEVGNLIHLCYLSLSDNKGSFLPQSVCRLHHLEVMLLRGTIKIDDSTLDGMSNLVKLRQLDIPGYIMEKIPWIGKVTSLEELEYFGVREECGYNIGQLKYLKKLRKLDIRNLENVKSSEEAGDANLIEKKNLDRLSLVWYGNRSGGLDEPLLDNLRPHTNLKELTIEGYAGVRSPDWITATSLSNITCIKLCNCERWEDLTPFGQLPLLKFLHITRMWAVKKLWCSGSVGGCAFPSLLELELNDMPDLELFEGEHVFPLLTKLNIRSCPRLKGLPALPLTLNQLEIWGVGLTSLRMMQQDCSSSEGRQASCSSSHPALSTLDIYECPNLTSLDGFMSQQQYFPLLTKLDIRYCPRLKGLPALPLTLNKLEIRGVGLTSLPMMQQDCSSSEGRASCSSSHPALLSLEICDCPNLTSLNGFMLQQQYFPALVYLSIEKCENLRHFLDSSESDGCASVTSVPLFPRLSSLSIRNCKELSSLDGLQVLPSLQMVFIRGCDKLIELSLLQPPLLDLTSTSHTDMVLRPSMELEIDRQSLLRLEPLRNLNSVSKLTLHGGTELASLDEQWLLQNRNSLLSLKILKAPSLESLPPCMIELRSLHCLSIRRATLLQSIPELPTSMESLSIGGCPPELKEYIEGSGKFTNIPCVVVKEKQSEYEEKYLRWEHLLLWGE